LQVARRVEGDAARQSLAYAEEGVGRLARILDQLLMLARVEGSVLFEDGESSRPADVVELALRDTGVGQERFVLPEAWPEAELALPRELAITALRNLVDNALRHGGECEPVTVTARLDEAAGELSFRVRDRGPGVDDKTLVQMSQRFWRASKQRGSGLGLAIVMAIVERFAGRLEFARPNGAGLEACLTFPVKVGR
ncbi:MAG: ATP-binding protein, partial [Halomonas sp.]|nr:ATP-binding protein [Halomonas sp.]